MAERSVNPEGSSGRLDPIADAGRLLHRGRDSKRARTRNLAQRILSDLETLAGYVEGETEVARLEAELSAAKRRLNTRPTDEPEPNHA